MFNTIGDVATKLYTSYMNSLNHNPETTLGISGLVLLFILILIVLGCFRNSKIKQVAEEQAKTKERADDVGNAMCLLYDDFNNLQNKVQVIEENVKEMQVEASEPKPEPILEAAPQMRTKVQTQQEFPGIVYIDCRNTNNAPNPVQARESGKLDFSGLKEIVDKSRDMESKPPQIIEEQNRIIDEEIPEPVCKVKEEQPKMANAAEAAIKKEKKVQKRNSYQNRDCATDKHGKKYTLEEIVDTIRD